MGVFNCQVSVCSLDRGQPREIDATVDTAATYTMLPTPLLRELGISPARKGVFEMGDGRRVEMDVGNAWVAINGTEAPSPVIFGGDDTAPLLGAVTLEILQLAVDPVGQRLVPTRSIMY